MKNNKKFTGYYDDNKNPIFVGDRLKNIDGYNVIVVEKDVVVVNYWIRSNLYDSKKEGSAL